MKTIQNRAENTARRGISISIVALIAGLCLLAGIGVGMTADYWGQKKIAHINTAEIFNAFQLTQELESKMENTKEARQTVLTNLRLRIEKLESRQAPIDSLKPLIVEYQQKEQQFETDNQTQYSLYNEQIWTQLNQYMQNFCERNGYAYLLGANGTGNLMGADPTLNVTEDVLAFVNQQYLGN